MKKAIATILLFVLSSAVIAVGANIDVSLPTHSTNNNEYDRNPSITYYDGSYWLFFTKGDDISTNGIRGPGYNPDHDGYVVYYKAASTIEDLASATETKLNLSEAGRPSGFDQRVVTAVVASDGSSDCIYAIVSSGFAGPDWPSHGMYHYKWDGSSWTGPVTMINPEEPDQYGAHVNAVSDGSTIYIVWDSAISNFFTYDPSTGTITGPTQISTDNMPKITIMGTVLCVISIEDGTGDIEVHHSPNYGLSWYSHSTAIPGAGMYDPCIFNDGTNLYVVTAPSVPADRQYMIQAMSISAGTTWSTARTVSYGGYGSTEWWDYWPCGYYDGSNLWLFFTTETSSPTYSDGEIAFTKMDWDLGNDHYFYIQNAVDQATAGDVINVAAGLYTEALSINDKGLTITGDSETGVIVQADVSQTGAANTFTIDAAGYDITIENMTIRHGDYGIRSSNGNVNVLHCTIYHNGWDGQNLPNPPTQGDMLNFYNNNATDGGSIRIQNSAGSEIAYNTVYENDRGVRYQDSDNGNIHNNVTNDNIQAGLYLVASSYTGATGCSNTVVHDNESYGNMNNGLLSIGGIGNTFENNNVHDNWNSGVMLWHVADNIIENNDIVHNNLYSFNGQGNNGDAYGGVYAEGSDVNASASFVFKLLNNTITDNEVGAAGQKNGLRLDESLSDDGIEVTGNYFSDHDVSIHIRSQAATTLISSNSIIGNAVYSVENEDISTVDASINWWGINTPSGVAGEVSALVDYTPWLDNGADTEPGVPGFQGDFSELWVDDNSPQTGTTGRVQESINLVTGSTVNMAAGTYVETIDISKDLTLSGENESTVTIDASSFSDYGIYASGDYTVILENFTVEGPTPPAYGYGIKVSGDNASITIQNVTLQNSGRSGFDINGVIFGDLQNLTATGNGGAGLGLTDCDNVTIHNVTTSGNAWAGIGIFTRGEHYTGGSDNIVLTETNTLPDFLYTQIDNYSDPANPYPITNLDIPISLFGFIASSNLDPNTVVYLPNLTTAIMVVVFGPDPTNSYIIDRSNGQFYVGQGMTIQAAVDAAGNGDIINVLAGKFEEQVVIDKNLTLTGAGKDVTIIESPATLTDYFTTSGDNYPIVYIHDADVDIENLTVDGLGRGNANNRFVGIGFWNAGGSVNNVRLTGVRDEPFSGAQHGVSIYTYNDTDGPYTINVTDVDIDMICRRMEWL